MNQDVQDALCFALWHHQGGSSTIGQPIRKMFGLGPNERMDKNELEGAKRVQQALSVKPQRTWVGLTEEEANKIYKDGSTFGEMMRMIEAKLKEKNT